MIRYSTRFGGSIEGERLTWTWPSGTTAQLEERCWRVDDSCLFVATRRYLDARAERRKNEAERAKKQF